MRVFLSRVFRKPTRLCCELATWLFMIITRATSRVGFRKTDFILLDLRGAFFFTGFIVRMQCPFDPLWPTTAKRRHEHLSTRGYSSWTSLTAPRALNHLPRGQESLAHRAGRRASSGDSGFSQCGGASVGDAHPAARTNERRFPPPSARDLPARRACRQAGRQTKSTPLAPTTTQLHQHIHTRAPPSLQWFTLTFRREA